MSKDKQTEIEEMVFALTDAQHAFDRAWKEWFHRNGEVPDRENVFYAKYLVEKKGYRKASDLADEIFAEIEDVLNNIGYFDELDFEALKKKYTENL